MCTTQEPTIFERYRRARQRTFDTLAELREHFDVWLSMHESGPIAPTDLAEMEDYNRRRSEAVEELQEAEGELMHELIRRARAGRELS